MLGWILAAIIVAALAVGQAMMRKVLPPKQYQYHGRRKWRTPRTQVAARIWGAAFLICLPIAALLGWQGTWGHVLEVTAIGATLTTVFIVVVGWICCATSQVLLCGPEEFLADLRDGGDPFFDIASGDPLEVQHGLPPGDISPRNFLPPPSWTDTCPTCGARQPGPMFWCWNCKAGWDQGRMAFRCPNCEKVFIEPYVGAAQQYEGLSCTGCGFVVNTRQ